MKPQTYKKVCRKAPTQQKKGRPSAERPPIKHRITKNYRRPNERREGTAVFAERAEAVPTSLLSSSG